MSQYTSDFKPIDFSSYIQNQSPTAGLDFSKLNMSGMGSLNSGIDPNNIAGVGTGLVPPPMDDSSSWFGDAFGSTNDKGVRQAGYAPGLLKGIGGITQALMGYKGLGIAEDELLFKKDAFKINHDMQMNTLAGNASDIWRSRTNNGQNLRGQEDEAAMLASYGLTPAGGQPQQIASNSPMGQQPQQPSFGPSGKRPPRGYGGGMG